ncbi:ADP-ribosyl cyclase/cyclic ADP-ribose hydrolase-like [Ptychodera flava]|uniref:ADP-ribosyl cyclase/cyclic ADP-ribose hydrolase-like n=1 Tax=Ptychodera flava TaxID=63121 RepID=UPI00396A39E6
MESAAFLHFMIVLGLGTYLPCVTYCSHFTVSSEGTPQDIEETIIDRCDTFNAKAESNRSCQEIWQSFKKAFALKSPCQSEFDYSEYMEKTEDQIPNSKTLLWSGVKAAAMEYSKNCGLVTLGDTLTGFLLEDLTWCGKEEDPGINYETCEPCGNGTVSPYIAFWKQASENIAIKSSGVVSVMLSGKNDLAYNKSSFFAMYELPNLDSKVTEVRILLRDKTDKEHCNNGTVNELKSKLVSKELKPSCIDNETVIDDVCNDDTVGDGSRIIASTETIFSFIVFYLMLPKFCSC